MRSRFAMLLAIAVVCVTTAWATWTSESLVTGSPNMARELAQWNCAHKVVFGTDGVGHLVWSGGPYPPTYHGVWYNRYNPGSGGQPGYWMADLDIAPLGKREPQAYRQDPCIALGGDGKTSHVVWIWWTHQAGVYSYKLCYRRCTQDRRGNDKWDAIGYLDAAEHIGYAVVACVPGEPNHVVVCWEADSVLRFREYVNGAWTQVVELGSISNSFSLSAVSIAAAPNGDVFVAHPGYDVGTSRSQIFVKTRHNGVWGEPVNVTKDFPTLWCIKSTIEASPVTDNPHVVFAGWTEVPNGAGLDTVAAVYHTFRNASGAWLATPELVSEQRRLPGPAIWPAGYLWNATMAFAGNGAAHVVWWDSLGPTSRGVMYRRCLSEGGTWSTPELLTSAGPGEYDQCVAVQEPAHAVHVVWERRFESYAQIWWKSDYSGGGGGQAQPVALSQSGIELFPNPAKAGRVTVQYALPHAEPLRVTLLDVSGRAVWSSEFDVRSSGEGSVSIDVRGLSAGVYVVRLAAGGLNVSRTLVVER